MKKKNSYDYYDKRTKSVIKIYSHYHKVWSLKIFFTVDKLMAFSMGNLFIGRTNQVSMEMCVMYVMSELCDSL